MKNTGRDENTIERVTEIYVAVFPIPISEDHMTETILAGFQGDLSRLHMSVVRATVETLADLPEGELGDVCFVQENLGFYKRKSVGWALLENYGAFRIV